MAVRGSANYQPSSWEYSSLQTLPNPRKEEVKNHLVEELMQEVRQQMNDSKGPKRQLEIIEAVDRLGLASLFQQDIYRVLSLLSLNNCEVVIPCGLRATATCFRLLRRFGFQISDGIFDDFMDEDHKTIFMPSLSEDVAGLLSLYNASDMAFHGEQKMDAARSFAMKHLQIVEKRHVISAPGFERAIAHVLNLPLHQRMPWLEGRMYIDMYELEEEMSSALLQLAKIRFNDAQKIHQQELKQVGRWWTKLDWGKSISFSRDRLMECFFYIVAVVHDPDYGFCREKLAQVGMLAASMDDVYDIYGSLEELELFTHIIERWDINDKIELPDYMKICFSTLNDTVNEVTSQLSQNDRLEAMPYIKRVYWLDLFKAFLEEAKWHKNGYIPTLKEYLSIASISSTGHVLLFHAYILLKCEISKETLQQLHNFPNIIRLPSLIFRLCNDLATSSVEQERGDAATSIQCYMNENGASEEQARLHIERMISDAWKEMNREYSLSNPPFPRRFIETCINLARMASCMYRNGDGFSSPGHEIKASIMSFAP